MRMKKDSLNEFINVTLLFCFYLLPVAAQERSMPNVLIIHTDDHRFSGVHILGKQAVQTPNLDQLAEDGIAFTNAYLQGSFLGATCIPSRAMLLTGRNLFELDGGGRTIPKEHRMAGEAFMDAGYYAYHIGKWHQDFASLARSFHSGAKIVGKPRYLVDQYRMPYCDWQSDGSYEEADAYLFEYNADGELTRRPLTKEVKRGPTGTEKTGPHVSEVLVDEAAEFIKTYERNQPFFIYLAFPTPHDPRQAPQKYKDMYPESEIELPPSYMPQHPFDNGHIVLRDELLDTWPRTKSIVRKHLSDYYAIITHLDAQIGRVIEALKASGQYKNTIIVMAGDSGLAVGNHGLLGKQNVYDEDGIHIPLMISGGLVNEMKRGSRVDALCYNYDIMPTICDLAGISTPESVTGRSLVPIINGELVEIRDHTYHAYRQHQRAYRKGDYKLIEYVRAPDRDREGHQFVAGSRVTQLFNLSTDPWESFNLADFPEHKDRVVLLRSEMQKVAVQLGDQADGHRTEVDFWEYWE